MFHVVLHFVSCSESYTLMYLHVLVCTVYGTYIPVLVHQGICFPHWNPQIVHRRIYAYILSRKSIYQYIPGYTI